LALCELGRVERSPFTPDWLQSMELRRLVAVGSPSQQIANVIAWLQQHYTENVPMDDLRPKRT